MLTAISVRFVQKPLETLILFAYYVSVLTPEKFYPNFIEVTQYPTCMNAHNQRVRLLS